tara:strand:+ start:144 stop:1289 length:1146 start_codon:yes stop_codon:yes gene_type:complete
MFRKGGSAGEGITSGLAPRQGYEGGKSVEELKNESPLEFTKMDLSKSNYNNSDLSKLDNIRDLTPQQILELSKQMSFKAPPMATDNSMRNFKIDFGLDLVGRSPSGNIFQTAALAGKEPFANFKNSKAAYNKGVQDRAINKFNSESDMFKTLIGAQGDILGSEGGSKSYESTQKANKVKQLLPRFLELKGKRKDGEILDQKEVLELRQLQEDYNAYRKSDPGEELLMEIFVKGQGDRYFTRKMEELFKADIRSGANRKYKGDKYTDDPQVKRDAVQAIKIELEELTYADGGRAGYAEGELVEEQVTETETMAPGPMDDGTNNLISFDQMRARLPAEITDDIIELMVNSAEALEDFAMISDQSQVDQFNKKYSVNLVLPAEA